jgi:hypothetical protein
LDTVQDDGRWVCAVCRAVVRSYTYRFHPADSSRHERCVGLSWCSGCRVYTGAMVHVPRGRVLTDALAFLPPEKRERLMGSESRLIEYLDSCTEDAG